MSASADYWGKVIELLPRDRPVISYDLRGHGTSGKLTPPWTVDDFAKDHVELLDALGLDDVDLVGCSLGGIISQAITLNYPERVHRLVLVSSVAGRTPEESERSLARLHRIENNTIEEIAEESVVRWHTPEYIEEHPEVREKVLAQLRHLDRESYAASYRVLATTDHVDRLGEIAVPTVAITGEGDVGSTARMSELIAERVQNGRAVIVEERSTACSAKRLKWSPVSSPSTSRQAASNEASGAER
ncbi:alpha/beta fold hydrolase [Leucobacter soli]|uniref:alpha/beta fold hydrolase n=1 Tax=Leucobacter soli TaxID=2812850 RepID=UPI00360BE660